MIIKGHGINSSSNIKKFTDYLFVNEKNEEINILNGSPENIKSMFQDAHGAGLKYGCQHFIMSSKEEMTTDQAISIIKGLICKEYNQNYDDLVIVNHQKERSTYDSDKNHYHIIIPHCDPITGKAINLKNSKRRNEKISRLAELELGHALVKGRHNSAVYRQLQKEGRQEQAQAMEHLTEGELPQSAYGKKAHQKAEKTGLNLPEAKAHIKSTWQHSPNLSQFLKNIKQQGYTFKSGDKPDTYIIEKNNVLVGSANRLIGIKKDEFKKLYQQHIEQEIKENEQSTNYRNQARHNADNRIIARDRRPISIRDDSRSIEHDITATSGDNLTSISSNENNNDNAGRYRKIEKIKINHQLKNIKLNNYSHIKIIDDAYISEIKDMLKNRRKEDYQKIRNAYSNLKGQFYYVDTHKKKYNLPILNIMYNCFSRLFKFQKNKIIKPDVEPPLKKQEWQKLTREQQNTLRYSCLYHYQDTFKNMQQFNKINKINDNTTFQDFLHILKEKGDFMSEEVANLYPYEYIKKLDDEYLKRELSNILKGVNSQRYTKEDIQENIISVCENLLIDKDIKEKNAEDKKIKLDIERMKSIYNDDEREEQSIRIR